MTFPLASLPANPSLRPPQMVMNLARLGCFHQTRLSFMRALMRALRREQWHFSRARWAVDARGVGVALYRAERPPQHKNESSRCYTLVCFAKDLPPQKRSDRVIAEEWDATFALYDGIPDDAEIARLAANVPKQEAGQCRMSELVLARANRSVRLFAHVVEQLANGAQPRPEVIEKSGYLMRTTAVYGNGKFGLCDREGIAERPEFAAPFRAELLAVWLIRWFTIDIAEHLARAANPQKAVKLNPDLARRLGVGNATGLGMAPFLLYHPALLHQWIYARETALARVRAVAMSSVETRRQFRELMTRMRGGLDDWRTDDARQGRRIAALKADLALLEKHLARARPHEQAALEKPFPWDALIAWSERELSMEGRELLVTLTLEPHGELVDDLSENMAIDESRHWHINGRRSIAETIAAVETHYAWALQTDYGLDDSCARFWYVSEEKLEPRLGERRSEPGAEKELPLAFARDIAAVYARLKTMANLKTGAQQNIAEFLSAHPQHRHAIRRIQLAQEFPYGEIRDNLIAAEMKPIDLLRCKLSFFGANKFDPKSDRWVRITMYQYAPLPPELAHRNADDWSYPPAREAAAGE